jgi:hypothetical protein
MKTPKVKDKDCFYCRECRFWLFIEGVDQRREHYMAHIRFIELLMKDPSLNDTSLGA